MSVGLGHVGLNVTDLDRAERFFQDGLGFRTLARSDFNGSPYALLGQDGVLSLTLWQQSAGAFSVSTPGLHHLAFQVTDADLLDGIRRRLEDSGARILHGGAVAQSEGGSSSALYFEGPDGIRLEVSAPSGGATLSSPTPGAPACGFF